jgi:hypothetical protein
LLFLSPTDLQSNDPTYAFPPVHPLFFVPAQQLTHEPFFPHEYDLFDQRLHLFNALPQTLKRGGAYILGNCHCAEIFKERIHEAKYLLEVEAVILTQEQRQGKQGAEDKVTHGKFFQEWEVMQESGGESVRITGLHEVVN